MLITAQLKNINTFLQRTKMKKRVIYNDVEVLAVLDDNNSITYTADKVICADVREAGQMLRTIGIDTTILQPFELEANEQQISKIL
jgi:hypothetical protein